MPDAGGGGGDEDSIPFSSSILGHEPSEALDVIAPRAMPGAIERRIAYEERAALVIERHERASVAEVDADADHGALLERPGTRATAYFPISFCPGGIPVSFGDSGSSVRDPVFYLLGALTKNPDFIRYLDRLAEDFKVSDGGWPVEALAVLWRPVGEPWLPAAGSPLSIGTGRVYREIGWSVFVNRWEAPSFIAGFKCGDLNANHTQLDNNSFQLWTNGEWLAADLGGGVYNKAYFSEKRWGMYVVSTAGHNAVLIGGRGQLPRTKGTLESVRNDPELAVMIGDASACYGPGVTRARRHFAVLKRAAVVVVDEVTTEAPQPLEWRLHSARPIEAAGDGALVRGEHGRLAVRFAPGVAMLAVADCPEELPPGKLDVVLSASASAARSHLFAAALVPLQGDAPPPVVRFTRDPEKLGVEIEGLGRIVWRRTPSGWRLAE